jgi:hypothetical protein
MVQGYDSRDDSGRSAGIYRISGARNDCGGPPKERTTDSAPRVYNLHAQSSHTKNK